MGQRTAILTKKTFKDSTTNIRLMHLQWGHSNWMHKHFIREFLFMNTDKKRVYTKEEQNFKNYFTFNHLIMDKRYDPYLDETYTNNPPDVFDKETIKNYYNKTDNNNGGLIIDVKERSDSRYITELEHLKIAFIIGPEDCRTDQDKPFSTLMTGAEYIKRTDPELNPSFTAMWKNFVEFYGIEEVTD